MTITREDLRNELANAFEERARIDQETHGEHHSWIGAQIQKERERTEMYASIKKAAIQWSVTSILGAIFYLLTNRNWHL